MQMNSRQDSDRLLCRKCQKGHEASSCIDDPWSLCTKMTKKDRFWTGVLREQEFLSCSQMVLSIFLSTKLSWEPFLCLPQQSTAQSQSFMFGFMLEPFTEKEIACKEAGIPHLLPFSTWCWSSVRVDNLSKRSKQLCVAQACCLLLMLLCLLHRLGAHRARKALWQQGIFPVARSSAPAPVCDLHSVDIF